MLLTSFFRTRSSQETTIPADVISFTVSAGSLSPSGMPGSSFWCPAPAWLAITFLHIRISSFSSILLSLEIISFICWSDTAPEHNTSCFVTCKVIHILTSKLTQPPHEEIVQTLVILLCDLIQFWIKDSPRFHNKWRRIDWIGLSSD